MAIWAIIMGCAMCIAQVAQINVNWLVLLIGVLPAIFHRCLHSSWRACQNCLLSCK